MKNSHDAGYGGVAMLLHWVIGLALLAQIVFGFALDELAPRGTPARGPVVAEPLPSAQNRCDSSSPADRNEGDGRLREHAVDARDVRHVDCLTR